MFLRDRSADRAGRPCEMLSWGLELRGLGFGVEGSQFRVQDMVLRGRVYCSGYRIQGFRLRVLVFGFGFRDEGLRFNIFFGARNSGDTPPCKVTPVILHGVASPDPARSQRRSRGPPSCDAISGVGVFFVY